MNTGRASQGNAGMPWVKLLADLLLNYLRWTQFIQLLSILGLTLLLVTTLTATNWQDENQKIIERAMDWILQLPWLGEYLKQTFTLDKSGGFSSRNLGTFVLRLGAVLSLAGMLLDMLWHRIVPGERRLWPLKRKLGLLLLACISLLLFVLVNFFMHRETFVGGTGIWMVNFSGLTFVLFMFCAWSMTVIHVLDRIRAELAGPISFKLY